MSQSSLSCMYLTIVIVACFVTQFSEVVAGEHHSMIHHHLSRKILDRACAASKDTIDEIVGCFKSNKAVSGALKPEIAQSCHKDAFGAEFNPNEIQKHKEEICQHKDKFEQMTACVYEETTKNTSKEEIDKLSEALVDMGLCIINALDS